MSSSIAINSNIAALNAQRRLAQSTGQLRESFERLSSGLRINRAKDDAAGLAISEELRTDARVFTQGIRNLNDGVSLLNIAESAIKELSSVVIRIQELAQQSANGVLSNDQRQSLDQEADALVDEYNRIMSSTKFNGINLLDGSTEEYVFQGGYGEKGQITASFLSELQRTAGDGTFSQSGTFDLASSPYNGSLSDLDGDGHLDLVVSYPFTDRIGTSLGNGDGTFQSAQVFVTVGETYNPVLADFNNDGEIDVGIIGDEADQVSILLGNGDGTFQAHLSFDVNAGDLSGGVSMAAGDFNNDGNSDIITANAGLLSVTLMLGNGNGTFSAGQSFSSGGSFSNAIAVGDFNGDGNLDAATANNGGGDGLASVFLGDGSGSFTSAVSYGGADGHKLVVDDFNQDGLDDIAVAAEFQGRIDILLANSNGSFRIAQISDTGHTDTSISAMDLNGDEVVDLVSGGSNVVSVLIGNADGSFSAPVSFAQAGNIMGQIALGDINEDGAVDIVIRDSTDQFNVLAGNPRSLSTISEVDLSTQSGALAALDEMDEVRSRVTGALASIGADQSRLAVATANLAVARENYMDAASRIRDADIAAESARLVRQNILQQAGAAVLAQANASPELALLLLSS